MSEMVERAAKVLFLSRYSECAEYWPDRLDECVSGPPFDATAYRDMARTVIASMREPTEDMIDATGSDWGQQLEDNWHAMIDQALVELGPLRPAGTADLYGVPRAEE